MGRKISWKGRLFAGGGIPELQIKGKIIYEDFAAVSTVNNAKSSTLGNPRPCKLLVYKKAILKFRGKVGMSNTVIVATQYVEIGNNVMIGSGVTIVDSDFHSLNYNDWGTAKDQIHMCSKPVIIGDNVFLGMNSIILKGVTIGDGAVIGAGSVVSKNIPPNEIWAGNPVHFIAKRK